MTNAPRREIAKDIFTLYYSIIHAVWAIFSDGNPFVAKKGLERYNKVGVLYVKCKHSIYVRRDHMSGYGWKKYGLHRFTALLLAGVLVVESAEFGTLTAAAQESVNGGEPAAVSVNEVQGATLDGDDPASEDMDMSNACGYVAAPDEAPAPVSELNLSLDQAKSLLENTDSVRTRVMAADRTESVPAAYPYSYDQTEKLGSYLEENLPAVRNQNPYGTCWAHATTGTVEMDMITRYGEPTTIDYSELHLIYWSLHQGSNPIMGDTGDVVNDSAHENYMRAGGNSTMTSQALLRRRAIAAEETLPYNEANTAAAAEGTLAADPEDEFNDVAYLNNHYRISISGNADNVKEAIMEHGGVQVSYYDNESYYSSQYNSFYNPTVASTNHAVMLVGWDDSFPKESFSSEPSGDGAWLVRNSWGYASYGMWSRQKYFWMSYHDAGLLKCDAADVFEMIPADQGYDNQYFYDSQLCLNGYYSRNNMKAANVYTVGGKRTSSAEQELLEAVSIVLVSADAPYTVEVYTGLSDGSDPTSGTLAAAMSGTAVFAGEYTLELPEPVTLDRGELFSVVVTGNSAQEYNYSDDSVVAVNEGESFINWGYGWKDQAISGYSGYGNFRIYALTRDTGEDMIQNLTVSRDGTSASLTWDAFESADSYAIYRGETSSSLSKIGETTAETTSYTDTGIDTGKVYYYQVKTNSGANVSGIRKLLRHLAASDVTMSGTERYTYDGQEKAFQVTWPEGVGANSLVYYKVTENESGEETLTAFGTADKILMPGTYQLGIRLTEDGTVFAASDQIVTDNAWRIVICKKTLAKNDFTFEAGQTFVADGEAHFAKPQAPEDYTGTAAWLFAPVDPETKEAGKFTGSVPVSIGTWQASVSGSETDIYEAFEGFTDVSWRFRIVADKIEAFSATRSDEGVELSWDPVETEDAYAVYRGTSASELVKIADVENTAASYRDTTAAAGQIYYYRIETNDGVTKSDVKYVLKRLTASAVTVGGTGSFAYDGEEKNFAVTLPEDAENVQITYYKVTEDLESGSVLTPMDPTEKILLPGTYRVGVKITEDGAAYAAASSEIVDDAWVIVITKLTVSKENFTFTEGGIFTADSEVHSVKPQAPENYTGTLSYKYAPVNGSTVGAYTAEEPTGVGIWQVSVDGTTTEIYDSFTGLTDSTWRFRIVESVTASKPTAKIESGDAGDGAVTDGARITLATVTSGAVIYYTLDGSAPTMENGVKYTGGITLYRELFDSAGELTLKAVAFKSSADGYVASDILEYVYRIKEMDYGDILKEDKKDDWTSPDDVPDGIWIGGLPKEVSYTGKAIQFDDLRIYDHVTRLTPDDYKITYSPNVNAGTVTVTVKGNGNYTGQISDIFTITKADIGAAQETGALAVDDLYLKATGKDLTGSIKPTVKWNGITLKLNKDYKVVPGTEGEEVKEARSEWYVLKLDADAAGSQNFTGKAYFKVKVYEAVTVNLSKVSVTKIPTQVFRADLPEGYTSVDQLKGADGQPLAFVVKNGKEEVPAGAYSVRFENADRSGTATLILTATEDGSDDGASDGDQAEETRTKYVYTGVKKVTFKIASTPVKNAFVVEPIPDQTYTGSAVMPEIIVKDKAENVLKKYCADGGSEAGDSSGSEAEDAADGAYTVKYSGNIKAGTAKAVITGRAEAGYSGSLTVKFKINKYGLQYDNATPRTLDAATCDIEFDNDGGEVRYVKGQTNPAVRVRVPSDEAEDGWITLTQGTDYTVKYANNKAVANATDLPEKKRPTIIITGKGGYTTPKGGIKLYYSIVTKDIDSDEITKTAKDKVYKNAVNSYKSAPVLTDANGKVLKAGTDYEKDFEYVYAAAVDVEHKEGQEYIKVPRYTGDPVDANDIVPVGAVIKVIIHGANNYTGDTEVSYRIVKYDLAKAKVTVKPQTYTGAPVYPDGTAESNLSGAAAGGNGADVTVTLGGKPLTYGTDYTITDWSDNVKAGKNKASLTIAGCEDNPEYGGSKKVKFSIIQKKF